MNCMEKLNVLKQTITNTRHRGPNKVQFDTLKSKSAAYTNFRGISGTQVKSSLNTLFRLEE